MTSQIRKWAARQLADYDARQPGMLFAEGVEMDVAEAYAVQAAIAQLRTQRGERVIGYKVGCTSPKIQSQLGIDHCITGRLYNSERHEDGVVLSRSRFANLAIEGELAIELACEPNLTEWSSGMLPRCIARVFPVIELHHYVVRGQRATAGELIAGNAIHAGFVEGTGIRQDPSGARIEHGAPPALSLYAGDRLLEECAGEVLIQTICDSLRWLDGTIRRRGQRLSAGQIILTGSVPGLFPIEDDCTVCVEAPPFGSVNASLTA